MSISETTKYVRPTHAVQLIFICSRTPDAEQADWGPDIDSISEKLGARHIYARPVELPPAFQGLWDPGVKPPTEWPPPKPGGGHRPGVVAHRNKEDGSYATFGGVIVRFPREEIPLGDLRWLIDFVEDRAASDEDFDRVRDIRLRVDGL